MSNNNDQPQRGSEGGKARAAKLSKAQLSESGAKAATSRWAKAKGIPKADYSGSFNLNGVDVDCAVVEINGNPVRLLSERSVTKAIGGKRGGSHWLRIKENKGGANLPVYISATNLAPFIDDDLKADLMAPIQYVSANGAAIGNGIHADVFPRILWVYQDANSANALLPSQAHLGEKANILLRALTNTTMTALVDEATGYQAVRAKDALASILSQYIMDDYRKWTKCFPLKFYKEIFRLKGWEWTEKSIAGARPGVVGKYTDDIVYDRLAPGVLDELQKKNPTAPSGRRKLRHYWWLSEEVGHPKLITHLEGAWVLMRQSEDWDDFKDRLDDTYPIHELTELGIEMHVKRKKIGSKRS